MTFESVFIDPRGRTPRREFIFALMALLAAAAFYFLAVPDIIAQWCVLVLILPFTVLHARRLQDMGRSGWLALIPAAFLLAAGWPRLFADGAMLKTGAAAGAIIVATAFALWGAIGKGRAQTNRLAPPPLT